MQYYRRDLLTRRAPGPADGKAADRLRRFDLPRRRTCYYGEPRAGT
jgi:hypothetical protein